MSIDDLRDMAFKIRMDLILLDALIEAKKNREDTKYPVWPEINYQIPWYDPEWAKEKPVHILLDNQTYPSK